MKICTMLYYTSRVYADLQRTDQNLRQFLMVDYGQLIDHTDIQTEFTRQITKPLPLHY